MNYVKIKNAQLATKVPKLQEVYEPREASKIYCKALISEARAISQNKFVVILSAGAEDLKTSASVGSIINKNPMTFED